MLTTLLACTCEASEDGDGPYVRWVAAAMHLCVYADNARDVAALVALAVHVVAWLVLYFPQLYLNWRLRSSSSQSVLCVAFLWASELFFLLASLLEQFAWFWSIFRIWRLIMISALTMQILYYKLWVKAETEAQMAEAAGEESFLQHVDASQSDEANSFGWPSSAPSRGRRRSPIAGVNIDSTSNKASGAGLPASWGESLLSGGGGGGGGGGSQRPTQRLTDPGLASSSRSHSPARSRGTAAAASQQQAAPRSAASNASASAAGGRAPSAAPLFVPSSHSISTPSPVISSLSGGDNEKQRLVDARDRSDSTGAGLAPSLSGSGTFQASSSSAFRPVVHTETVDSSAVAVDFANVVTTTQSSAYSLLSHSSANQASPIARGGSSSSSTKLLALGFCIVGLTFLSVGGIGGIAHDDAWSSSSASVPAPLPAGRVLLSSLSNAATDPHFCNEPYDPPSPAVYAIRVFSWLGCVFACMSAFPQIIYNSEFTRSTAGLSFATYGLLLLANLAWVVGVTIPRHNDWMNNRYARGGVDDSAFYRDQVVLPLLIAHGFTFLTTCVFVVQRRKYSQTK